MARRRGRRRNRVSPPAAVAALGGGFLALSLLVQAIRDHPWIAAAIAATVLAAGGAWLYLRSEADRRLAEHERNISVTDTMTGPEFEHFVARLMRASGYRGVRVSGGAGDMGADVTAKAPDGRRVVVQCKRYTGPLGSPHVQKFAGTARDIHGADVALLVTTGHPTRQARDVARRCRITLVDRATLARWVTTRIPPLP
ncbi:restriction endonuclease [Actinoplanes sp. NPDC023801]|uniref:restriction endonuclease n=1 Tax=Actinoplanes sp. NPDC023801 TaxID=3154595 RepID=UPI0033C88A5C